MIEAELKNKCGNLREQEDALTSTVFGILKYKMLQPILIDFLSYSVNTVTKQRFDVSRLNGRLKFQFWPRLSDKSQIDILITSGGYKLGIEVKYFSGESGEGQLKKYSKALDSDVVYVTMDHEMPDISEKSTKIYWLSWHILHKIVDKARESLGPLEQEILFDLLEYLENRKITCFSGFTVPECVTACCGKIFWENDLFNFECGKVNFTKPIFFSGRTRK